MTNKKETLVEIRVWDIPTRLFHWLLVLLIFYAWFAVDVLEDMQQHFWAGYGLLSLILFRLGWGFFGTRYARFNSFVKRPSLIRAYARTLGLRDSKVYLGHNPLGGLAVMLMLLVLLVQAGTGLFNSDDYFHGPLSGLVSDSLRGLIGEVHELSFNLLLALISLHIAVVLFYIVYKKQNLILAMLTGKKSIHESQEASQRASHRESQRASITSSKLLAAIIVLAVSIAVVYFIATGFTDSLPSSEYDYSF